MHFSGIRQKCLIIVGEHAKSIPAYTVIMAILECVFLNDIVFEYAKSILTCMENTLEG
jgi:hypothetical protein